MQPLKRWHNNFREIVFTTRFWFLTVKIQNTLKFSNFNVFFKQKYYDKSSDKFKKFWVLFGNLFSIWFANYSFTLTDRVISSQKNSREMFGTTSFCTLLCCFTLIFIKKSFIKLRQFAVRVQVEEWELSFSSSFVFCERSNWCSWIEIGFGKCFKTEWEFMQCLLRVGCLQVFERYKKEGKIHQAGLPCSSTK